MKADGVTLFNICVFCGSSDGTRPEYRAEAARLGTLIAGRGWGLVYGAASIGLMGAVADAVLAGGGPVVGVLPAVLHDKEVAHAGLSELVYVDTMHERKMLMADRADAFVALPGGFGTLDELMEIMTWAQLGIHAKPIVPVNTLGYFDGLLAFLDNTVRQGFVQARHLRTMQAVPDAQSAVNLLATALPMPRKSATEPVLKP